MDQNASSEPVTTPPRRNPLGYVALIAFVLLFAGTFNAGSVEVYGVSIPVWLYGLGMYLIGVVAMWSLPRR